MAFQEQFIVDAEGKKTGVILPLKRYQKLMEDLRDLAVVAERRAEEPISLEALNLPSCPRRVRRETDQ